MKTNSLNGKESQYKESEIFKKFPKKIVKKISKISGYEKRKNGKIKAWSLIIGFMIMISKRINTYEAWASEVSVQIGKPVTRQAIEERINPETVVMLKMIFEEKLKESILQKSGRRNKEVTSKFKSIKLEDSTTLNLPNELSKEFPGNVSKGKKKAQAKIHALYNFTKNNFVFLHIHSFSENDQSLAPNALNYLNKGDLLIRDMGFLVLDSLEALNEKGVYYISRKSSQTKVYDINSGEEINLTKILRKKRFFDKEILVGKKKQVKMRLVILPTPKAQAACRRRKARQDRDKRLNHSKEYYELLGYSIYLTNIPQELCNSEEIMELYGVRWQIEIIFKSWKSCFSLEKLVPAKCKKPNRIYGMIYLMLTYILLFQVIWFNVYGKKCKNKTKVTLSLLKMAKFFAQHFCQIMAIENDKKLIKQIKSQCCYDTRNDRLNTMEKYGKLVV